MTNLPKDCTNQSGGINIYDTKGSVHGEFVGRDKIIHGLDEIKLIDLLDRLGLIPREKNYLLKISDELDKLADMWINIAKYMSIMEVPSADNIRKQLMRQSMNYAAIKIFVSKLDKIKDGKASEIDELSGLLHNAIDEKGAMYVLLDKYINPERSSKGERKDYSYEYFTVEDMEAALELTGGRRIEAIKLLSETESKKEKKTKTEIEGDRQNIAKEVVTGAEEIAFIAGKFRALVHSL